MVRGSWNLKEMETRPVKSILSKYDSRAVRCLNSKAERTFGWVRVGVENKG